MPENTKEAIPEKQKAYRVLARKYRPQNFTELIGQDALVRTLTNAIESGRIAHAFMLTGVRGVGKTTTARIIAKALNYKGPDGTSGPTTGDTSDCGLCKAIAEDRHPDVIEMDAASRTGVEDIREILDGVRYAPSEARYKIYIIDEVHMLSKNAFNALLKTLEEPPEHVKFIFATTEIRKVPITVLSRCQRFDLRRVDIPTLSSHFKNICDQEKVGIEDEALALISRAADGSVRDGLSLLDQAIALAGEKITATQIQDMLGLADRARGLDLLEHALSGNMPEALDIMDDLYRSGADPVVLLQDLLDLTHILTKLRAVPNAKDMKHAMAADQIQRAAKLANELTMPTLGKTWQILLKGLSEVQRAPNPQSAAEMVLIRLAYAADLPDPADLLKKIKDGDFTPTPSGNVPTGGGGSAPVTPNPAKVTANAGTSSGSRGSASVAVQAQPLNDPEQAVITSPENLEDVVALLEQEGELILAGHVFQYLHLVSMKEGLIEVRTHEDASTDLTQNLRKSLIKITGNQWMVSISSATGAPTLAEQAQMRIQAERDEILATPIVNEIMQAFPGAELIDITHRKKK